MYLGRYGFLIPVSLLAGFMLSPPSPALAVAQTVQLVNVDAVVGKGVRVSKLIGSTVINDRNERLGSIDDIIIDEQGRPYAVLEVGGFLGLGGRRRGIGLETVRTPLRAGRSVRALARSAVAIPIEDAALDKVSGDALDRDTV